ncbi:DUF485 domain-containing protein [Streptomyces sp. SID335]|uniref:DUF485 domain-containing protein n=1 Tax=Streptomyces venezuelae TaxID=54571 RepID=A0A5P2BTT0_STRVZ|nr:DUF485 domain-containing protein [Streptomyces sp. SID335]MYZ12074.1 DUF485 domain-containing protein [Streptomyces sp. SID337]NDZ88109.1 DUF485 domain-containing protein [Streptomyces sp. SID10115]NEA01142.1 DUF485 domain-containing protein [Streptomyces sp. SID10116]NEB44365.1 DUF485 domain-containing protein [Streptomyces sp. SID339]QES31809.1 DUF485 domain-containing protein [Streptomyces venezuelae]
MRDPWYDTLASGWGEIDGTGEPASAVTPRAAGPRGSVSPADIYVEVQRSAAFQEVRGRYRRFVVPGVAFFFTWYVAYVVAATTVPGLMARPVSGAVNVAMVAGLGQFLTTFLLTWAYARHARLRRDRAALDLRWAVFEQKREQEQRAEQGAGVLPDAVPVQDAVPAQEAVLAQHAVDVRGVAPAQEAVSVREVER